MITLVGRNYLDTVADPDKYFFVMVYSNLCGACKDLAPNWNKLAKEYTNRSDIVIGKMDVLKNEVDGIYPSEYPSIYFHDKANKTAQLYKGKKTLAKLQKWVKKKTGQLSAAETAEPDEVEEKKEEDPFEGREGIERVSAKPDKRAKEVRDAEKKAKEEA